MKVNDRVRFVGPRYGPPGEEHGPTIGQVGTLTARDGHHAQRYGYPRVELVTVSFDGDEKPTVLDINRLEVVR